MKLKLFLLFLGVLSLIIIAGCSKNNGDTVTRTPITVYKSESCGCCDLFTRYIDDKNFQVNIQEVDDVTPIKERYHIPQNLQSCHTSIIGDYFVEGHMPVEAITKLMAEKPDIAGIALPGMPSGSPGMPGAKRGQFIIYALDRSGSVSEFMRI